MLRSISLVALMIGLVLPTDASAQRRGGSGGGRGWSGGQGNGSWGNGSWQGGRGNWNNGGNRGYYGGYYGFGGIGGFYGGYNNYGGGYNSYPYNSYGYGYNSYPYSSYDLSGYSGSRSSAYFDPNASNAYQNGTSSMSANRARVEVILPDANADLLIQGQRMELSGRSRVFTSPDLEPGKMYIYTITMRRMINGRNDEDTRKVEVRAGSNSTLDFSTPAPSQFPKPAFSRDEKVLPLPK